jgi:hypothetical protein
MTRLYEAATQLCDKKGEPKGLVELSNLVGESPQTVKNWEARGMSAAAMLKAEEKIGCRAVWLKSGTSPMTWIAHAAITGRTEGVDPTVPAEAKILMRDFEKGGPAKRDALLKLAALPEQEMATLLLVLQSISEKYKR